MGQVKKVKVENIPTEDLSKKVRDSFEKYGQIEYLLSMPHAMKHLKREYSKVSVLHKSVSISLKQLKKRNPKLINSLLKSAVDDVAFDYERIAPLLAQLEKEISSKIKGYSAFAKELEKKSGLKDQILHLQKAKRKEDRILNEALYLFSLALGSTTAAFEALKNNPGLVPNTLAPSFNEESIRKRILRHKKFLGLST